MANISDKELQNIKKQLDSFNKKRDSRVLDRRIKEETRGLNPLDSYQKEIEIREEWRLATEKTTGFMTGLFRGLVGKEFGDVLSKRYAKANDKKIEDARTNFLKYSDQLAKDQKEKSTKIKTKVERKTSFAFNKNIKDIKNSILNIEKSVLVIQKSLTGKSSPEIKPGYRFDPRMAGGGRYINEATSRIVSKKEAIAAGRTEALTKAIMADEDPMIRLADTLEQIFKSLGKDNKSVHNKLDDIESKIESMDSGDDDGLDLDIVRRRRTRPKPKGRSRSSRVLRRGKLGGLKALRAARTFTGTAAGTATLAATGAVAVTAAGAYALDRGMTKIGTEAKGKMDVLESKYGLKTKYNERGFAIGYEVQGKKYGLDDLPQEYKDLIEAYGPGDKRSFTSREALKRIKENPKKYKALEIGAKPAPAAAAVTPAPAAAAVTPAPAAAAVTPAPAAAVVTPGVAGALSAAAAAPASAVGVAPPAAPSSGPQFRLGPAAAARGKIDSGAGKNAALAAASKAGITGSHLAQFMAQLDHESGGFKHVEENLRYSASGLMKTFPKYYKTEADALKDEYQPQAIANRVYANRMGNGPPESGDGYKYRGRGLIQLTGKDNYKRFGQLAGVDLVSNPDMAGNLGTAADIAAAFYKKNVIEKGIDGEDTAKVTKAINGGSIGLSHRESLFASYMRNPAAMQPSAVPTSSGPEPQPSMYAKGQDQKISGGGGGGVENQQMIASAQTQAPITSPATVAPVQNQTGVTATQESRQMATNQMVASTVSTPAPVVINNNSGNPQPIQPPKQPLPKASSRPADSSFNRALAKDFTHPTSFTSVAPV